MPVRRLPFHSKLPWTIAILCLVITISLIYAFAPFIPSNPTSTPSIALPYLNSNSVNLSIQLPNRTLHPYSTPHDYIDDRLSAHGERDNQTLYLVQLKDSSLPHNLSIITSFPTHTYLVRSNPNQINLLAQDDNINFVTYYAPEYKLHPDLLNNLPLQDTQDSIALTITLDPAINQDDLIAQLLTLDSEAQITTNTTRLTLPSFDLTIQANTLIDLARLPQIIWIEPSVSS